MTSSGFIETGLTEKTADIHRALASLQEELEAMDYYHQRVDVTQDEKLKAILAHNRDDEMEHAAMLMEWLRRELSEMDGQVKKFLFTTEDLPELAESDEVPVAHGIGLGLGGMKQRVRNPLEKQP